MFVLGGTSARTIAEDISKELQQPLIEVTYKRFPDDEFYVRILDDVKGEDVLIIQTTYPDTKIVELLLMQDAVYEAGANEILIEAGEVKV